MSLTPGARLGVYEIVGLIGAGGMGEVYRARDARLNRDVAIKVLPPSFAGESDRLDRFEQEARAAAALNHPNILSVFDVGSHEGAPYVVAELLEGETLRDRLNSGAVPVRKTIDYAIQLAHGLAAAHEKGIVHRDLKPENVFVTSDERVKILDFGLAKLVEPALLSGGASTVPTTPRVVTQTGMMLGTMGYASPEQLRGLQADYRADIFSFGVILYELLSGQRAFTGPTPVDTMTAILKETPAELPVAARHIPPALVRIVDRCLEKNAAARFQSTRDLGFALEGVSSHGSETGLAAVPSTVIRRSWWSKPRVAWLTALMCAAGCAAAIVLGAFGFFLPAPAAAPEMRLQIHIQDIDVMMPGGAAVFALSPDGRQFVFSARGNDLTDQRVSLWLRALNSDVARQLAGTEGALTPFWSPDGQSVGFFAGGQLKRIDLSDGLVRTLASAPNSAGGAWNSDGTILFTKSFAGPIYRIAASGGSEAVVTRTAPPVHSGHVFPDFLPDGRRFLFYSFGARDGRGVYTGSLESGEIRRIFPSDAAAVFMPPDWLLLSKDDALMAQRVDLTTLEPRGTPVAIARSVFTDSVNGKSAVSASMVGPIAYKREAPERRLAWLDRAGRRIASFGDGEVYGPYMALSPDGRSVAVVRRVGGNTDVWVMDVNGGGARRVTSDAAADVSPVWSPDSSRVAFGSDRKSGVLDLYVNRTSGSAEGAPLVESPADKVAADWSPDGKWILYAETDSKTGRDLWVKPLSGDQKATPVAVSTAWESNGRFSPDNRWIAFQSNQSTRFEIYVQPFPGPGEPVQVSAEGGVNAHWSRDGRELFYRSQGHLVAVSVQTGSGDVLKFGPAVRLFELPPAFGDIEPSPDGQRFLVNAIGEVPSLVTVLINWSGARSR